MEKNVRTVFCLAGWMAIILVVALGCQATPAPAETPTAVPPTATPLPPTPTPLPPTPTPEPEPWEKVTDIPTWAVGSSALVLDGEFYVVGGHKLGKALGAVQVYDPATDAWDTRADMPTPRSASACVLDAKIYTFGGSLKGNLTDASAPIEVYDPATDTWDTRADMPTPRSYFGVHTIDDKVYVFGGDKECSCSVEVYDPETDTWERRADMPTPRILASSFLVDGRVYVVGGYVPKGGPVSTVDVYDPATDTWTQVADLPTPRSAMVSCVLDDKIYAISGFVLRAEGVADVPVVEVYDPIANEWQQGPDIPQPMRSVPCAAMDSRIYVFGGPMRTDVWEYDPAR